MKKKAWMSELQHRFLEAFVELESAKAGHTISYVELARWLEYGSSQGLHQQLNRYRDVADETLNRIRVRFPEYTGLIDSLLYAKWTPEIEGELTVEIEKVFTQAREVKAKKEVVHE